MRSLIGMALGLLAMMGCGKSETEPAPVYTAPDGIWTYTTPDKTITVEFELVTTTGTLEIQNVSIEVDEVPGAAVGQLTNVDLPMIEQLRINANDAALVVPYAVTFNNCTVGSDYNLISVPEATYTWPWGQVNTLTDISITRKP